MVSTQNGAVTLTAQDFQDYLQWTENKSKYDTETARFKKDCRKRALDAGAENAYNSCPNASADVVMKEADKFYEWLTKDLQ